MLEAVSKFKTMILGWFWRWFSAPVNLVTLWLSQGGGILVKWTIIKLNSGIYLEPFCIKPHFRPFWCCWVREHYWVQFLHSPNLEHFHVNLTSPILEHFIHQILTSPIMAHIWNHFYGEITYTFGTYLKWCLQLWHIFGTISGAFLKA